MKVNWDSLDQHMKNKRHSFWRGVLAIAGFIPRPARRMVHLLFASVSPIVPVSLRHLSTGSRGWSVFLYGAALGLFFCYVVNHVLTVMADTYAGTESDTVYFSQDYHNLFFYLFVCPIYVGLCAWVIHLFMGRYRDISILADDLKGSNTKHWIVRFPLSITIALAAAAAVVYGYMRDILSISNVPETYWFMTAPIDGSRYLNNVGVYYVILNFGLMLLTATAILCFFGMFFETLRVGDGVAALGKDGQTDFSILATRLGAFTEAYIVAKWLCADYILNITVWKISPLGRTANVDIAYYAVTAMGLFFISFPRYYVELMWHEMETKLDASAGFRDIRGPKHRVLANVVDVFFIAVFLGKYNDITSNKTVVNALNGWLQSLMEMLGVMPS